MPRRTITDEEIALIKAMLRRGMRNRDIQFYFNRQDRPVNSGRITGIRQGDYGPDVAEANDADLDAFLATFAPAEVGVVLQEAVVAVPSMSDQARARFAQREDTNWYLVDGETADQECKMEFNPRRMEPIIRAIAAMANNRGGFIFIGVRDEDHLVEGMPNTAFQDTDVVRITDKAKSLLTPTPIFQKDTINFSGKMVGVIHVEKHSLRPVIVCRDANGLEDGAILFRYPGQSGKIKFGDLLEMLRERDRSAQRVLLSGASRLSEIGTDRALIVDTEKGELNAQDTTITIDKELADQLKFLREGDFQERDGAPALKLLGEVHTVDNEGNVIERVEGHALSPDMALLAYLNHELVKSPIEFVRLSALVQRQWLPIFYFVRLAGVNVEDAINTLNETDAVYRVSKARALSRLRGRLSAFSPPGGAALEVVEEIQNNRIEGLRGGFTDIQIVRAVQCLPGDAQIDNAVFELLKEIFEEAGRLSFVKGGAFKAATRLDEIEAAANFQLP